MLEPTTVKPNTYLMVTAPMESKTRRRDLPAYHRAYLPGEVIKVISLASPGGYAHVEDRDHPLGYAELPICFYSRPLHPLEALGMEAP